MDTVASMFLKSVAPYYGVHVRGKTMSQRILRRRQKQIAQTGNDRSPESKQVF